MEAGNAAFVLLLVVAWTVHKITPNRLTRRGLIVLLLIVAI